MQIEFIKRSHANRVYNDVIIVVYQKTAGIGVKERISKKFDDGWPQYEESSASIN